MSTTNTATVTFDDNSLRRVPTNTTTNSQLSDPSSHAQDWAITTDDKDSWAAQERRRSSVWSGLDVPVITKVRTNSSSKGRSGSVLSIWDDGGDEDWAPRDANGAPIRKIRTSSSSKRDQNRRGSILSVWSGGKDDKGRSVMLHDDVVVDGRKRDERRSSASEHVDTRTGSILSMWKGGKDEKGRDVIHHDDHEVVIEDRPDEDRLSPLASSPPRSIDDRRRGSILSIWKGAKDEQGRDVMGHDDQAVSDVERSLDADRVDKGKETESRVEERKGSILSLWKGGIDKDGKHVIHHDDQDDIAIVEEGKVVEEERVEKEKPKPVETRRGSILSMWQGGTDARGVSVMHHHDEE